MDNRFAIWGIGDSGRNIFYKLSLRGQVECWYNEEHEGEYLYNCPIKKYEKDKKRETIIIAENNWTQIYKTLKDNGLQIVNDFLPVWMLNSKMIGWRNFALLDSRDRKKCLLHIKKERKIAIMYGNCQTELIQRFLGQSEELISKYIIINIPRVCQENKKTWDEIISMGLFQFCDLFIYQVVADDNRFGEERATSNLLSRLSKECKKVSIPNIYFDGYFPQLIKNKNNVLEDVQEDGLFKWGDIYVDDLIKEGMSKEKVMETIFDDKFLTDDIIKDCIDRSFYNLEKRENTTDIKISDYIKQNYSDRQMFYAPNHPNNELLLEMSKRILDYLGFDVDLNAEAASTFVSLMGEDVVVYPAVIRYLNLKQYYKKFFPNRYIENLAYSSKDYYSLYYDIMKNKIFGKK